MNNLTRTLLCGAALCAFVAVPAIAESAGPFDVTALHANRVVKKTKMQHGATHVTSTISVFTYVPGTVGTKAMILFEKFCNTTAPVKVWAPKKTFYGKISVSTETSNGCEFVEGTYKVINQPEPNTIDSFPIILMSKFEQNGTKYKGTLNLDYNVLLY
jgi:hypothetical protein